MKLQVRVGGDFMNQVETKMSTDHDQPNPSPPSVKLDSIAKKLHKFFVCVDTQLIKEHVSDKKER